MEIQPSDQTALEKSKASGPFLVTKSTNAVREVLGGKVKLKTDDTVYDFHSVSFFKMNEKIKIVQFDLDATTP